MYQVAISFVKLCLKLQAFQKMNDLTSDQPMIDERRSLFDNPRKKMLNYYCQCQNCIKQ